MGPRLSRARGLREVLRRLLGRPPSDWAGPDPASVAARRAAAPENESRHEVVCLGQSVDDMDSRVAALAAAGHRVLLVSRDGSLVAESDAPYARREVGPRLFDVRIPEAAGADQTERAFEALNRLRREDGLGAAACVVRDRGWLPLAERLRAGLGWPTLDLAGGVAGGLGEAAFAAALRAAFPPASVVIVTYNNRELNRLCLESVFARTEWPRCEVIVVDNGSTDGTPELLSALALAHEDLKVVALPENRGYPAACNAGLAKAAGDPLVLLNNDTVVTRGWLTALVRHLAESPRLGMVGPVTNAIANEARVDVGYSADLAKLPRWASAWVREHDGETFPIPMLAFFCVAVRRAVLEDVGPLDERFGLGLFEDGDYNRRVRDRGWEIRCARDAFVHHWQNASFRRLGKDAYFALYEENRAKYEAKWRGAPGDAGPSSN